MNICSGIGRRLKNLGWLLFLGHKRGGYTRGLRNIFAPRYQVLARDVISDGVIEGAFKRYDVRGCAKQLLTSLSVDSEAVKMVAVETGFSFQWHYYENNGTGLEASDVVMDCGSAEGLFTLLACDRVKQVIAIEPVPEFLVGLQRSFGGCHNVLIVPAALGEQDGVATIQLSGASSRISEKSQNGISVKLRSIDSIVAEHKIVPTYIKADLEGYERHLIAGAANTIKQHKPKIAITVYHRQDDAEVIKGLLLAYRPDYRIIEIGVEPNWGGAMMIHAS
jgi:FkbM family methyltransferase